jgi:hypothetical protein
VRDSRENQKRYAIVYSVRLTRRKARTILLNGQAGRQEKLRPQEKCFFHDSSYGTTRELSRRLNTDSVKGARLTLLGLLWADVPLEANGGAHLSLRLQRQTVMRGAHNRHVFILNNLKLIAAARRNSFASFLAPHS